MRVHGSTEGVAMAQYSSLMKVAVAVPGSGVPASRWVAVLCQYSRYVCVWGGDYQRGGGGSGH
jgi:hypothetical protein